ncbi:beta-ketoacyl synthase N-terminal-like domain-containing protein [Streptomyces chartreusis]|uniref:beta-ketoacyl synthase N-terminal-like domain-containing protein n=1 Tax=Streptomyces chartreusis TaxID=1969 RepID=UPI0038114CEA
MPFPPVAIVARSCVLPGALDPDALWRVFADQKVCLSPTPPGRWRLAPTSAGSSGDQAVDRPDSAMGGYVQGFASVFDPNGFALPAEEINELDPVFQWSLHTARLVLRQTQVLTQPALARTGLVLGNLSYPSASLSLLAEHTWLAAQPDAVRRACAPAAPPPHARNRFCSGLPALLTARALGLGAGAFALDASCASSLYAIKKACDRLHDNTADLMLAGAVNCSDDMFVHAGFNALSALSPTGRSLPFDQRADGLLPAEGAVMFGLMRLADAVDRGMDILGVIRGIGLSNDGRFGGLLAPSVAGQEQAMRLAYQHAEVSPASVGLLEAHATGTPLGDSAEIISTSRVFSDAQALPIGSAKSNVGHLITAAGGTALLKVLGAMQAGIRPATAGLETPIPAFDGSPLRALSAPEDWPEPRRAGISAFGFGGNNAHLIVDQWPPRSPHCTRQITLTTAPTPRRPKPDTARTPVAVVAVAARLADASTGEITDDVLNGRQRMGATPHLELTRCAFPPKDLAEALPQQVQLMEVAKEAAGRVALPRHRTQVITGMGCDAEAARYAARWRVADRLSGAPFSAPGQVLADVQEAFIQPLIPAGVVGTMPNMVANRIGAQLDVTGPVFTVSAEQASGLIALRLGARAIQAGEADAVVVGAVDFSHETVHQHALAALGDDAAPADAAVVLILKRHDLARKDGEPVLALLDDTPGRGWPDGSHGAPDECDSVHPGSAGCAVGLRVGTPLPQDIESQVPVFDPVTLFGSPHAARGLLSAAVATLCLQHGARPASGASSMPWLGPRTAEVRDHPLEGAPVRVRLSSGLVPDSWVGQTPSRPHVYSGVDTDDVVRALDAGAESRRGPVRLVILAQDTTQLRERSQTARSWLLHGGSQPHGVYFRHTPLTGQVAFVYPGGAAAYPGMAREQLLAFPSLAHALSEVAAPAVWAYQGDHAAPQRMLHQVWATTFLGCFHTRLTRDVLGVNPDAAIGYSTGETTALTALGVWPEAEAFVRDASASPLFDLPVDGPYEFVKQAWQQAGTPGDRWSTYLVGATPTAIASAIADEPAVHLTAVNTGECCTLAGEDTACKRVLARLAPRYALLQKYTVPIHVPELQQFREAVRELHDRPSRAVPDLRFYTCSTAGTYDPASSAADTITEMTLHAIDFRRTIERAWEDGVRIFIEHGPRDICTSWIHTILKGRDYLALSLDSTAGPQGVARLAWCVAQLLAAGVPVNDAGLPAEDSFTPSPAGSILTLPGHPDPVRLPHSISELMAPTTTTETPAVATAPASERSAQSLPAASRKPRDLPPSASPEMAAMNSSDATDATPFERSRTQMFCQQVRTFVTEELLEKPGHLDVSAELPLKHLQKFQEAGLSNWWLPESYGGLGLTLEESVDVVSDLAYGDAGTAFALFISVLGTTMCSLYGNEELRDTFLQPMGHSGGHCAVLGSEKAAGSELMRTATTATRRGGDLVLRGEKFFCANADDAEFLIAIAVADDNPMNHLAVLLPRDTPGLHIRKRWDTMGLRSAPVYEVSLEDCRVPARHTLEGPGISLLETGLNASRTLIAATAVGISRRIRDISLDYAKTKTLRDSTLLGHPIFAQKIGQMETQVEVMRNQCLAAGREFDTIMRGEDAAGEFLRQGALRSSLAAKVHCGQAGWNVASVGSEMFGGLGYTSETIMGKLLRDVRYVSLVEGGDDVCRELIFQRFALPRFKRR